jgi:hypothetical protein
VRYYPRRVGQVPRAKPLSPSQALHLANDPGRTDRATRTADRRDLVLPETAAVGRWQRLRQRWSRRMRGA